MARRPPPKPETIDDLLAGDTRTLSQIAVDAGVSRRTLFGARAGRMPRRDTLAKLATALEVDLGRLRAAILASRS